STVQRTPRKTGRSRPTRYSRRMPRLAGSPVLQSALRSVVAIFGPTASGKTAVAEAVAEQLGGEVVSADSMQAYRGLPILTAHRRVRRGSSQSGLCHTKDRWGSTHSSRMLRSTKSLLQ